MKDFDNDTQEVRSYVRGRMRGDLPPNFVEDVMSEVNRTPQRRRGWIGWPLLAGIATAAAGVAVVAIGLSVIDRDGVGGNPTPTPTSSAQATTNPNQTPSAQCVNPPPDILALINQTDPVACYGSAALTVDAYLNGVGAIDCPGGLQPALFSCERVGSFIQLEPLRATAKAQFLLVATSTGPSMFAVLDPASGLMPNDLAAANWRITGHYDDPAAQLCHYTAWSVLWGSPPPAPEVIDGCRGTFVVTAVVPLER